MKNRMVVKCPHCGLIHLPKGWQSLKLRKREHKEKIVEARTCVCSKTLKAAIGTFEMVGFDAYLHKSPSGRNPAIHLTRKEQEMSKRIVFIMVGPSGSGKTTWLKNHNVYSVSADDYFSRNAEGEYRFNPTKLGDAHADCFARFLDALGEDRDALGVDNTNTTPIEADALRARCEGEGMGASSRVRGLDGKRLGSVRQAKHPLRTINAQCERISEWDWNCPMFRGVQMEVFYQGKVRS